MHCPLTPRFCHSFLIAAVAWAACAEKDQNPVVAMVADVGCPDLPAPADGGDGDAGADATEPPSADAAVDDGGAADGAGPSDAADDAAADVATEEDALALDAPAPDAAAAEAAAPCGTCAVELANPPLEGANHTTQCGPVSYGSKPPSSGTHYPVWPVFRVYSKPVPWGFLVHGLEHGAIVIVYNCPDGCPADVAEAEALWKATSARPGCGKPPLIVAPDPTLDVRFAATAWGHTLRAPCFDAHAFADFIREHANMGPEFFPTDCGAVDLESTGWCSN